MSDYDNSFDSSATGSTSGMENEAGSVYIGDDSSESGIDYSSESYVDISGDGDNVEIDVASGSEVESEIDISNEAAVNFVGTRDESVCDVASSDAIDIGEAEDENNAVGDVDEARETDTDQESDKTTETNEVWREVTVNEYLESLPEEEREKQIAALKKMTEEERAIYAENLENEPTITKTMQEVAQRNDAELQCLERRIKTPSSTYGKMHERDDQTDIKDMNDIIRYTEIYPADKLAEGTKDSLEDLKSKGYEVERVRNTWDEENATYRGINAVLRDPKGQTFELQFHTQESFDLKNGELHALYEERRTMADDDPRAVEIDEKMTELSAKLERPQHIDEVNNV